MPTRNALIRIENEGAFKWAAYLIYRADAGEGQGVSQRLEIARGASYDEVLDAVEIFGRLISRVSFLLCTENFGIISARGSVAAGFDEVQQAPEHQDRGTRRPMLGFQTTEEQVMAKLDRNLKRVTEEPDRPYPGSDGG